MLCSDPNFILLPMSMSKRNAPLDDYTHKQALRFFDAHAAYRHAPKACLPPFNSYTLVRRSTGAPTYDTGVMR